MNEALVEHASAKTLIRQLERMKPRDPLYAATFTVLGEYVQHHVKEEEGEMFQKVRRAGLNLQTLGKKLLAPKDPPSRRVASCAPGRNDLIGACVLADYAGARAGATQINERRASSNG